MTSVQPRTRSAREQPDHRSSDLQIWTSARCNRLLRQISSRVSHLRQLVAEAANTNRSLKRPAITGRELPEKKRVRRTYGGRKTKTAPLSERDGNVSTPPRFVRALGTMRPQLLSSPAGVCCPTPIRPKLPWTEPSVLDTRTHQSETTNLRSRSRGAQGLTNRLVQISENIPADHVKIYEAILGWLEKLLQVTEEREADPDRKSLLGMCLRKIPECIDDLDEWDQKESENSGQGSMWKGDDAADAIYGQLDAFGSKEEGWKPFKHLVRSHALQILKHATTDGLFAAEFVATMAKTCARMNCLEEADGLIAACREMTAPSYDLLSDALALSDTGQICNQAIIDLGVGDDARPGIFPIVGRMLSDQHLLVSNILPKHLSTLLKTSLTALQQRPSAYRGTRLLVPALKSLATSDSDGPWKHQEQKQGILTSLAAGIAAAAMTTPSREEKRRHLHVLEAALSEIVQQRGPSSKAQHCGAFILIMARQLALEGDTTAFVDLSAQGLRDLASLIMRSEVQAMYRQTVALFSAVAHACSRSTIKPSHEILDELRLILRQLPLPEWFSEQLRSEGAFVLAQKTKDLRDLAFAETVSETQAASASCTNAATMFSGWRWEAGISEWVLPSPSGKAPARVSSSAPKQCEFDSISEESQKKRRLREAFMPTEMHTEPQRSGIDTHNATNAIGWSRTSQSKIQRAKPNPCTVVGLTRRQRGHGRQAQDELEWRRRGHVSGLHYNSVGKDRADENHGGPRIGNIGKTDVLTDADERERREVRRSSTRRPRLNEDPVEDGAQGLGTMRLAATTKTTSKVVRRKSTTALPSMRARAGAAGDDRGRRRQTTVSLSSLAMWPGSDDWDELL